MGRKKSRRYARTCGLKEIHVHFGTFDFAFNCVVGPWEGVRDYVSWKFETDRDTLPDRPPPRGMIFRATGYCPILWLPSEPRTPFEHATLAHEVLHAVVQLMEWAGIPLAPESEEAYCHALGYGVRSVLEGLRS